MKNSEEKEVLFFRCCKASEQILQRKVNKLLPWVHFYPFRYYLGHDDVTAPFNTVAADGVRAFFGNPGMGQLNQTNKKECQVRTYAMATSVQVSINIMRKHSVCS
jgi:hypothetical protein